MWYNVIMHGCRDNAMEDDPFLGNISQRSCHYRAVNTSSSSSREYFESSVDRKYNFVKKKDTITEPHNIRMNETERAEKSTYCRPSTNIYDREFIFRTLEQNSKLQQLVKKLVLTREKQQKHEVWNNYINELKSKHGRADITPNKTPPLVLADDVIPDIIDNYCDNSKCSGKQSHNCENLIKDLYSANDALLLEDILKPRMPVRSKGKPYQYGNSTFCFPTSSQARLITLNRQKQMMNQPKVILVDKYKESKFNHHNRAFKNISQQPAYDFATCKECLDFGSGETTKKIYVYENNKDATGNSKEMKQFLNCSMYNVKKNFLTDIENKLDELIKLSSRKNSEIIKSNKQIVNSSQQTVCLIADKESRQTDTSFIKNEVTVEKSEIEKNQVIIDVEPEKDSSHIEESKQKIEPSQSEPKENCLSIIENKLDTIMTSFNIFLSELKRKHIFGPKKSATILRCSCKCGEKQVKDDLFSSLNKCDASCNFTCHENVSCGTTQQQSLTSVRCPTKITSAIDEIMFEEVNKSDIVKNYLDKILSKSDCYKLIHEIPTKEHSTEVTESLYRTVIEEEIIGGIGGDRPLATPRGSVDAVADTGDNKSLTIAVNTDPLGILALFRVSAESVRQILSYVPTIDCASYLTRLNVTQEASAIPRYVCNMCGLAFSRPSQLSDHIKNHNFTNPNNCCVCRHVLDSKRHRSGLFACQHCGLVFTRAYCRMLHEQTCRPGGSKVQEVAPSLTVLS